MVTMIPKDIQVPITFVIGTSIMMAISPTVTNSVTLMVLLPSSKARCSSSDFWRCVSLLSLLYLAAFDFPPFPCNFSRVSRIWFLTSSSVGSTFATIAGRFPFTNPGLALLLALKPPPPAFGVILFGFGAPGTPGVAGGLGAPGFGAILLRLFLFALLAPTAPGAPGLLGVIFGSSFFFFGLLN